MSMSETHSENLAASDEEDYKSNIPYFDEANNAASVRLNTYDELLVENLDGDNDEIDDDDDDDDADAGVSTYASWANNEARHQRLPSNYTTYTTDDGMECCTPTNSTLLRHDIKYDPGEMLRPPSALALRCNYHYTFGGRQMQQPAQTPQSQPPPSTSESMYPHPPSTNSHAHVHAQTHGHPGYMSHYPGNPAKLHPNMWYPNATYGSSSSSSSGGGSGGSGGAGYYGQCGPQRHPYYSSPFTHDPMMDMLQLSNSGREARNRAEKNRRDKLNGSIQELSSMVPHVAESPRRVDKTAVLRFAAHGLRLQYVFGDTQNQQRPQFTDALMRLLDSFFITLTCHGQIVLISSSIEQHLGHCQADLYGQNILHITHPDDHIIVKQQLIPTDLESLFHMQSDDDNGEPRPRTQKEEDYIDKKLTEDKRSFTVRLARAGPRSEPTVYEVVKIEGSFRRSDSAPRGVKTNNFPSSLHLLRRSRGREDTIPLHTISGNDIVLIAIARIIRPPKIINRIAEANTLEYKTRHLIDGRIIDCDQRIGLVAGYMTDEVRNLSPFTFMHQDDVRWVIVALRQMYDCNSSYGESTYRLLTRNGNFIYLQSKGYLEIDKATNKVHSFVCINTLLEEDEGRRRVQEMKNKFSIIINTKIPQSSIDVPASENPQQLEKAVLCLIQNLQKSCSDDEDSDTSVLSYGSRSTHISTDANTRPQTQMAVKMHYRPSTSCSTRSVKTPPLALVPPETSSVKTSISKSISIVNVTAAKHLRDHQRVKSPLSVIDDCETRYDLHLSAQSTSAGCTCQINEGDCKFCQNLLQEEPTSTSLKRRFSSENEDFKLTKRRLKSTEIEHVLTSSLDQIGRTLNQQLNAAIELRDQSNKYEVPNSSQRIEEIMEEHQKQSEIYVNIKSEYEVQLQNKTIEANTTKTFDAHENEDDLKPR